MSGLIAPIDHAALMDRVYRGQRHIYDLTRKYYLFGRDTLIQAMDARAGDAVLEIGCGTGRNLAQVVRRWPGVRLHGLDISGEMLKNAQALLGGKARLARGDACRFDALPLLGRPQFDRVMLSYALSMIPDWPSAIDQALRVIAPGGRLLTVDFGDCAGLPRPLRAGLNAWLARFHVTPRLDLFAVTSGLAQERGLTAEYRRGPLGYFQIVTVTRPN